jgi:hypothetical protein
VAQPRSVATQTRPQENHASHTRQIERNTVESKPMPKPVTEQRAAQPKVIAQHKAAEPKASKKETPAKSANGKDPEQH